MIQLTDEQRRELAETGTPSRVVDPQTNAEYVLIGAELYEQLKPLLEDERPSREEQLARLRRFGERGGWDDPEMDVYNDVPFLQQ